MGVRAARETGRSAGEPDRDLLRRQLGVADASLGFLLLIIAATLLSYWAVRIQRRGLALAVRGREEEAAALPDVYPIRRGASAIIIGSLGFFLSLALDAVREAEAGEDPAARRSARANLWASLLVLASALVRLEDLDFTARSRRAALPGEEVQPEI